MHRPDAVDIQSQNDFKPFEVVEGDLARGLVLLCDHASNAIPQCYNNLGINHSDLERHIAYDIGARELTIKLARRLNVPAVLSCYSRLLIDPNRGDDDPTLIMKISDGAIIAGNVDVDDEERSLRIARYYQPYHDEISRVLHAAADQGIRPDILSVHSFTPTWKGVPRPWHAGVLWEENDEFARPVIDGLKQDRELCVGENEPYSGGMPGETVEKHGRIHNIATALIEIRQDLIADMSGIDEWADRLGDILEDITGPRLKD